MAGMKSERQSPLYAIGRADITDHTQNTLEGIIDNRHLYLTIQSFENEDTKVINAAASVFMVFAVLAALLFISHQWPIIR
jgi:hypothetical protein